MLSKIFGELRVAWWRFRPTSSQALGGSPADLHDNTTTHPDILHLPSRASHRYLPHPSDHLAHHGGSGGRSSRRVYGAGRNRPRQRAGVVAGADLLDAALFGVALPRSCYLVCANLSGHMASGSSVRLARAGCITRLGSGHRTAAGLSNRRGVPRMDHLRKWYRTRTHGRSVLCGCGGIGTRGDAPNLWSLL